MKLVDFKKFDWPLLGLVVILAVISLVTLASVSHTYFSKQLIWYVIAFLVIILGSQIEWHWLVSQTWFRKSLYWFSVFLLLVPFFQSGLVRGTKSWIRLGGFNFEPSELAKVALIIILAGFFSRRHLAAWQNKNIFVSLLYTLIPAGIIAIQPDMGSAIVILGIWIGFLALSGINKKKLFIGILLVVIAFGVMWTSFLKDYQKDRLIGFVSPEVDSLGVNYNATQSKIAIGSAGFWGKGFGNGTQVQFDFLPEAHTDFIFASFVEEWGIFGGLILLLTYVGFIFRITTIGLRVKRNDFKFIALGTGLVFLIHFFINIGSSLGIVPVIGISFPFVSYGGSNLLTSSLLLAIISSGALDRN
jgi:rod shape determining protein RodA